MIFYRSKGLKCMVSFSAETSNVKCVERVHYQRGMVNHAKEAECVM